MGWYRFFKDKVKGQLKIDRAQVAWYDMDRNGDCFDESWIIHEGDDVQTLQSIGMWLTYVELDENKCDKSRVFIHMDDGEQYELKLIKLDKNKRYSNFYDK
jgi:hypothetical protein